MAEDDPLDLDKVDQEIRINELRETAREIAGGEMTSYENPDASPEIMEQFWKNVIEYENAPPTSNYERLTNSGLALPPADTLSDGALHDKLWELIGELAKRSTFLYRTDHLSDRELYAHLMEESLHEMIPDLPDFGDGEAGTPGSGWTQTLDILGGCSDEDIEIGFIYYSDDDDRAQWLEQFPDYVMPERKPRPYDRDRLLPVRREERERREWLAGLHEKGYSDADINRLCAEEAFDDEGNPLLEPGCGGAGKGNDAA